MLCTSLIFFFFFFNDTATTEIYTLSLHDALPISSRSLSSRTLNVNLARRTYLTNRSSRSFQLAPRSEEHTSELQSLAYLVCRLLLEKKKKNPRANSTICTILTQTTYTSIVC